MKKLKTLRFFLLLGTLALFFGSCNINKNLMFKTPKDAIVKKDSIPLQPATEYTISKDDRFSFQLYTNNGEKIVDNMTGLSENATTKTTIEYLVRTNGTADLPILGTVQVAGLTVKKLEDTLAFQYASKNGYNDPFVQVKLTNQRVIVFPGSGADAKVVALQNNNTTLMEVIALAGGIADRGRADRVKLMRVVGTQRIVYEMDLSTIDGLKYADLIVQANDYIYVEPSEQVGKEFVESAAPIVSLFSSALIILTVLINQK